ncbi:unnamed protein product [Spodoptera exigua]|nr:unnamed protein product [Spodoptera exigua]
MAGVFTTVCDLMIAGIGVKDFLFLTVEYLLYEGVSDYYRLETIPFLLLLLAEAVVPYYACRSTPAEHQASWNTSEVTHLVFESRTERYATTITFVNDISVEGAPHSVAVDALQKAGSVVRLRVRRARRPRVVTLWRGVRGLGLGIAGGADDAAGGGGIFVSHIAVGGAAHHDGRLRLGDKILAVRDKDGIETSLIGATHAHAVSALRSTGDQVTLIVLSAGSVPPVAKTAPLYSTKTQATSCSTLHELLEEEPSEIPRCVRMVRLVRSGSRLGMDIVGGLGGEVEGSTDEDACGVFVSGVSVGGAAYGMLHRGDRILSVDGRDLTRATHEQAAAALKQYSGATVTIAAQYQPEQYERLRARIRAINAAAAMSPRTRHVPVHPDLHAMYPRFRTRTLMRKKLNFLNEGALTSGPPRPEGFYLV